MNLVIIEDDLGITDMIRGIISKSLPSWNILGHATSVLDGLSLIRQVQPDVAIMDVMIKGGTSFDILDQLGEVDMEVVFSTSYEKFAIRAFRISAIDYLLKPWTENELVGALEKAEKRIRADSSSQNLKLLLSSIKGMGVEDQKIALPTIKGMIFVDPSTIVYCKSDNTYTTFFLDDGKKLMISKTLKAVMEMLDGFSFCRVHNRILVNLRHVEEYQKGDGGIIHLSDGSHVEVSRRRKDDFLKLIKKQP